MNAFPLFIALTALGEHIARALERETALDELDDRTLADIGVSRSEIGSIESESLGLSGLTRLRIVARQPAL